MRRSRAMLDRLRSRARHANDGRDDDQQAVPADPEPDLSTTVVPATPRHVPYGIDLAAAWGWRILVIGAAGYVLYRVLSYFSEFTVPVAVAALITALIVPFVDTLDRVGVPRVLAAGIVLLAGLALVGGLLTVVGQQVTIQLDDLRAAVVEGIGQIQRWAHDGPLHLSDAQAEAWIDRIQNVIQTGGDREVVDRVAEVGSTLTRFATGLFVAVFAAFFFLYEGDRIWRWVVGLMPRDARSHIDSSGRVAWGSLTSFVRGTVLVAFVDAVGIGIGALVLQVPLALAISVLVFLGAFVPIVGALVSGLVAVLVALVAQGPWTALFMLVTVVAVQQIESNVLQPFLMGKLVAVHPLAILLAIGAGITLSGIVGALVAVPAVACLNAVVRHLADAQNSTARRSQSATEGG